MTTPKTVPVAAVEICGEENPILAEDPEGEIPLTCGLPKGHRGPHQDRRTVGIRSVAARAGRKKAKR